MISLYTRFVVRVTALVIKPINMPTIIIFLKALLRIALLALVGFIAGSFFDKAVLGILVFLALGLFWYVLSSQVLLQRLSESKSHSNSDSKSNKKLTKLLSLEDRAVLEKFSNKEKQYKKTLKANTRLQKILTQSADALPYGVVVVDKQNKVQWVNRKASDYLGIRDPENIGTRIESIVHQLHFIDKQDIQTNEPVEDSTIEIDGPVNSQLRLRLSINEFAKRFRLIAVQDVSNFRRVDQMRQDFIGNASHELRTPLTVIRGYLEELLEDDQLPEIWHEPVQVMGTQSLRMQNIIEDMLTLSNIESRLSMAGDERVHLYSLIEQVCNDLLQAFQASHTVIRNVPKDIYIKGEERELYSAFSNLLKNAFLYSPQQSEITLSWVDSAKQGQLVVIDQGPGIPPESIRRLTERFYRVDSGRDREQGGTGLGLAIVKHALMRHEANLSVESEIGKGSRFSCNFPAIRIVRSS